MFALPDAKRVRRADLSSSPSSSRASTPDASVIRAQLAQKLDISFAPTEPAPAPTAADEDDDEELEFRLFAAPTTAPTATEKEKPAVQRIRLDSPDRDAPAGSGGFVGPGRPLSYYFAGTPPRAEYAAVAVSGEEVIARARRYHPRPVHPARVAAHGAGVTPQPGAPEEEATKKRTRKSKRARIAARKKAEVGRGRREEAERVRKEKEEAEREKRTRRNREKKVKKRVRDKAKKVAAEGEGEGEGVEAGDDVVMGEGEE